MDSLNKGNMEQEQMDYDKAIRELNEIVESLDGDTPIAMQEYVTKARRAKELILFCQNYLHQLDEEFQQIFNAE